MLNLAGYDLIGYNNSDNSQELSQEDIKSEFQKYSLLPAVFDELNIFFEAKNACAADNTPSNKIRLCAAYELAFTSIKHEMHAGRISESDFLHLKALLQEESAI